MLKRSKTFWRLLLGRSTATSAVAVQDCPDERRAWVRFPANLETAVKPAGADDSNCLPARVRNISLGGINLTMSRAFQLGDMLSIEFPSATQEGRCNILACVVHCGEEADGQWSLGCNFSRDLSDADLHLLGATKQRSDEDEQRLWNRFPTDITAQFQLVATVEQPPGLAKVLNLSVSGVGLLVDRHIENGALLSVDLHNTAGDFERTMLACVVHINRRSPSEWALGCNFIRSLSEEDLAALLQGQS